MNAEIKPASVSEMLRITGDNTAEFMTKVAEHLDAVEAENAALRARIAELENATQ